MQPIGVHSGAESSNLASALDGNLERSWVDPSAREVGHIFLHQPFCTLSADSDIAGICEEMIRAGGEGLILRNPQGKYLSDKRNPGIVKVKLHDDSEALVIGHLTYQGRGSDRGISSLVVVDRDRTIFKLGSGLTDEIRRDPPPVVSPACSVA